MVNVNYGEEVAEDATAQITKLMQTASSHLDCGISEDIILEIVRQPGDKVLNIVSGMTIGEAGRSLPDNTNETIGEAAVLIKASPDYRFLPKDLSTLIEYFDSYPGDPKITWRYILNSDPEQSIEIFILKNIKKQLKNETD